MFDTEQILKELKEINPIYAGATKKKAVLKVDTLKNDEIQMVGLEIHEQRVQMPENIVGFLSNWINMTLVDIVNKNGMVKSSIFGTDSVDCKHAMIAFRQGYRQYGLWVTGDKGTDNTVIHRPVYRLPKITESFSLLLSPRHALMIVIGNIRSEQVDGYDPILVFDFGMKLIHEDAIIAV